MVRICYGKNGRLVTIAVATAAIVAAGLVALVGVNSPSSERAPVPVLAFAPTPAPEPAMHVDFAAGAPAAR